ncbi:hypothetical protein [Miniimonas sp. S16]|uniref:hypothetical protein n=1 Tax=Miniimonas sp. S16 TaxID=2171623 RepID=UPI000D528A0E|nr:hypothetical protein [Miniimonas sp. S16]
MSGQPLDRRSSAVAALPAGNVARALVHRTSPLVRLTRSTAPIMLSLVAVFTTISQNGSYGTAPFWLAVVLTVSAYGGWWETGLRRPHADRVEAAITCAALLTCVFAVVLALLGLSA